MVNDYHKGEPNTAYLFIFTKYGLADFLTRTEKLKETVLSNLNEAREKQLAEYDIVLHKPNQFSKEKAES